MHEGAIQRIVHSRIGPAEAKMMNAMREVQYFVLKRLQVMDMQRALLVRAPRRKMKVSSHFIHR